MTSNIHPQLRKDCIMVGRFSLSHLLLMNDANYPWFILVPDRENIIEIHQLTDTDQIQLIRESSVLAKILSKEFNADKLNIAALGNIVPQLHVHHIVRYACDPAWPAPVWGNLPTTPYSKEILESTLTKLKNGLGLPKDFEYF